MAEPLDLDAIDPVELAAALSQLPPTHALVAAARAAADVADSRREHQLEQRAAAKNVAADTDWSRVAMEHTLAHRMWEARAAADGPDSAAAHVAAQVYAAPAVPQPRPPCSSQRETAIAVQWARQWAADRAADEAELDARVAEQRRAVEQLDDHSVAVDEAVRP
jgi:hypothetical protein